MNTNMLTPRTPIVVALLLAALTALPQAIASELNADERERLTTARRAAAAKPEVLVASEQAKADRAQVRKLFLDYKSMREKAEASEAAHRKLQEAAMKEADPASVALVEKEKAAFKARMEKARKNGKAPESDESEEE